MGGPREGGRAGPRAGEKGIGVGVGYAKFSVVCVVGAGLAIQGQKCVL